MPAARVHVIHNGLEIDTTSPVPTKRSLEAPVITTIGNIRHVKGHDILLDAASQVLAHFPKAVFTIAGEVLEPAYYLSLRDKIVSRGLGGSFLFLGTVSDLRKHLETATVFILPSRSEGFSNALIEAMAAGLPCVATDVGGNAEAIRHGVSGFITPPNSPAALADALINLLGDPESLRNLGEAARKTVEAEFTSEAMMTKLTRQYRALLQR